MTVLEATEVAIKAAGSALTGADKGALAAIRVLADRIDHDDELREAWLRYGQGEDAPKWWKPLQVDNVSIPTYLKYCESLGLTPAGRLKLGDQKPPASVNKLTAMSGGIKRPKSA